MNARLDRLEAQAEAAGTRVTDSVRAVEQRLDPGPALAALRARGRAAAGPALAAGLLAATLAGLALRLARRRAASAGAAPGRGWSRVLPGARR